MADEVNIQQGIQVVVRVRPMNAAELNDPVAIVTARGSQECVLLDPTKGLREKDVFGFDRCFWSLASGPNPATQEDVYNYCGAAGVTHAMGGFNVCIMAYGQTGSGKTYTMIGDQHDSSPEGSGIIPRLVSDLFRQRERITKRNTPTTYKEVSISVACFEIYNENVRDLMTGSQEFAKLRVRQHPLFGPFVDKLSRHDVTDVGSCLGLIQRAAQYRRTASTKSNDVSSRSHAIFQLRVSQTEAVEEMNTNQMDSAVTMSMINLVDLAGSERIAKTGATGERLTEATYINLSLTTLRKVIDALVDKTGLIPYRESMLTWLLSESIGGNSLSSMVATVSASVLHFEETQSTLRYALRTKGVVNTAKKNESKTAMLIRQLREEIEGLRAQVKSNAAISRQGSFHDIPNSARATSEARTLTRRMQRMTCPPILTEVQHAILDTMEAVTEIQNLASRAENRAADEVLKIGGRVVKVASGQWDSVPLGSSLRTDLKQQITPRSDGQSSTGSEDKDVKNVRFSDPNAVPTPSSMANIPTPTPIETSAQREAQLKKRIQELEQQLAFTRSHEDIQDFIRKALECQKMAHESTVSSLQNRIAELQQKLNTETKVIEKPARIDAETQYTTAPVIAQSPEVKKVTKTPRSEKLESLLSKSLVQQSSQDFSTTPSNAKRNSVIGTGGPGDDSQVMYDEFRIDWVMPHLPPELSQRLREQVHVMSKAILYNNALVVKQAKELEGRNVEVMQLRREVMELRSSLLTLVQEEQAAEHEEAQNEVV